jgi:hypothetical protein
VCVLAVVLIKRTRSGHIHSANRTLCAAGAITGANTGRTRRVAVVLRARELCVGAPGALCRWLIGGGAYKTVQQEEHKENTKGTTPTHATLPPSTLSLYFFFFAIYNIINVWRGAYTHGTHTGWDGLHTRHLLESTHTNTHKHTQTQTNTQRSARPDKVRCGLMPWRRPLYYPHQPAGR